MRVLKKKYWPHVVPIERSKFLDAERWCYDNITTRMWNNVNSTFYFKQGADATAFALRWA